MSANGERSPRYAILIVNGYDRHGLWGDYSSDEAQRFPWIELCLRQVERHSAGADYEVLVYDNSWLAEHRAVLRRHDRVRVFPRNGARVERGHPARSIPWYA